MNDMDYELMVDERGVEVECSESLCTYTAMENGVYTGPLCPAHQRERYEWDRADEIKQDRGEYERFETDRSTG